MTVVVLASASEGRLGVLRAAGLDPLVSVSDVDEDAIVAALPGAPPAEVVAALATAKAERVASRLPAPIARDAVVIGCDTLLALDGRLHGKPGTPQRARALWDLLAGRDATLHTGHCVVRLTAGAPPARRVRSAESTVCFAVPTVAERDAYVAHGEPLSVAGGFTLDGLGGWFVERVHGAPSNVIGVSLPLLREMFNELGVAVSQLWRQQ